MLPRFIFTFSLLFCLETAYGQLTGRVGPLTSSANKASKKTCNVLNYGAKADGNTDLGPALTKAWADCKTGGLVYIPPGTYAQATWVSLRGGSASAIQLDGTIIRTGTDGGNMISIQDCDDFEFFSGNSKGAMQGYGYTYISQGQYGARFIRLTDVSNFSFHGLAFVDSASYYVVFDTASNGEVYNIIIRGIQIGMTDGIDIWGTNMWFHDIEVTNGDECICVKSPSKNMLIESIHCNISGGTSIGSLGLDTQVSNIEYRNLYMNGADPCYLKTNGGSGTVDSVSWTNVIVNGGPYILAVNEGWGPDRGGKGVQVSNLSFKNWRGYNSDNSRPTIRIECDDDYPCTNINFDDVNLWTANGNYVTWSCKSAYGSGACVRSSGSGAYALSVTTIKTAPNYKATTMPNDLAAPFPSTKAFTIPPVPNTYFPGLKPISSLLNGNGPGGSGGAATTAAGPVPTTTLVKTTSTAKATTPAATTKATTSAAGGGGGSGCTGAAYSQCGGSGFTGCTKCASGSSCVYNNDWYSQCVPT